MKLSVDFKNKVVDALMEVRKLYGGNDAAFSKQWGLNAAVWSQLKHGKRDKLVADEQWITMGQELDVTKDGFEFNKVDTQVFIGIQNDVMACKQLGQAMILVDDCGIGKTYTAKWLSKNVENCFYIDLSQCSSKDSFVRSLAKAIGVEFKDRLFKVIQRIKFTLRAALEKPVIIIDEGGFANKAIIQLLQELWNATANGVCGWYMMGAEGFRKLIDRGVRNNVAGYRELFNRYSNKYMRVTPPEEVLRRDFKRQLLVEVLAANKVAKKLADQIITQCMAKDKVNFDDDSNLGGLRMAKTMLALTREEQAQAA